MSAVQQTPPSVYSQVGDTHHVHMPYINGFITRSKRTAIDDYMTSLTLSQRRDDRTTGDRWRYVAAMLHHRTINSTQQLLTTISCYNMESTVTNPLIGVIVDRYIDEVHNKFFEDLLPAIIHLALNLPNICTTPIPLLLKQVPCSLTISQQQAACLIANSFLSTFPLRPDKRQVRLPQHQNMCRLFNLTSYNGAAKLGKLQCIINYLHRVTDKPPTGAITFERRVLLQPPNWSTSAATIDAQLVTVRDHGLMEDIEDEMLHVNFANKFIGGSVLDGGCAQEEIMCMVYPELLVSVLLTEELDDNECLLVTGCERFNTYTGYSSTFNWNSNFVDQLQLDSLNRRKRQLIAIDALPFADYANQLTVTNIKRELNKLYVGFHSSSPAGAGGLVTGNWGCGVFGGDPHLKAVLQLMAAAEAGRSRVVYCTVGNKQLTADLTELLQYITKVAVGQLYNFLLDFASHNKHQDDNHKLFPFLARSCRAAVRH